MPAPQYCPSPRELDDLELLLSGALAPRTTFDVSDPGITLALPPELGDATEVQLVDPEGLPLAHYAVGGALTALATPAYGPFRRLHLTPADARTAYDGALVVPVAAPPTVQDLAQIQERATGRDVVLLALNGTGTPQGVSPVGLVRVALAAAALLAGRGVSAHVVAAPLPAHGDAAYDHELGQEVAANYATADVLALGHEGEWPDEIADIVDQDQPADDERGFVVFFTGLSGSGKSTLARALHDLILEDGRRTVTSLDGDVVRRNLSKGLTFSREDRETNIARIGWVAAEISRHRGIAICSPIAPFDDTRQRVRRMVEDTGAEFVLVHVATPLEECERRDRKGLYAKARAGEIPDFTGISSPYEEPADATVRVDTTGRTIEDCLDDVLPHLPLVLSGSGRRVNDLLTTSALSVLVVAFGVGIVVGLTGMGGGALMTPALIFLGVNPTAAVANDLVAASLNKSVGAGVHWRRGSPNLRLAGLLIIGSVPFAFAGGFIVKSVGAAEAQQDFLTTAIGAALLFTAATYALRMYLQLRYVTGGNVISEDSPRLRPLVTILVGAVGGLLVGITSVGSGSLIMVALLLIYPTLSAVRLVGTDLVQAVPLVLAAAVGHVLNDGVTWPVLIPLVLGGTPGTFLGARMAAWVSQSVIRRGIVIVLTLTGLKMLGVDPVWVGMIGAGLLLLGPLAWGFLRQRRGLPAFDNNAAAWRLPD